MPRIYVALGTNLDDRRGYLRSAIDELKSLINITAGSSLYETAPMYVLDQPPFLNAMIEATFEGSPLEALKNLKQVERAVGRNERDRCGPREIDLDLIVYGNLSYRFESAGSLTLVVPHPRIWERRFVLAPLCEINPELNIPGQGVAFDLLQKTNDQDSSVLKLTDAVLHL